jgi:lipopolysaccharide export system protein LptC
MVWSWPDNLHSKLVFWLKILLPLSALAILSTLFMVSHTIRPEDAIPYAQVDIADLVNEPRLTAPDFAGMTEDGAALSLKAGEARLGTIGSTNPGLIIDLVGLLETPDGAHTDLAAKEARLDLVSRKLLLEGGVIVNNSAGYHIESQQITVALDMTSLDSAGPITATGPVGTIQAGSMHLGLAGNGRNNYVLVFKSGVKMIYLPSKQGTGN